LFLIVGNLAIVSLLWSLKAPSLHS
jgi:hypothetical protein